MVQEEDYQQVDDDAEDFVLELYWQELGTPDPYSSNASNIDDEEYIEE